MTPLGGDSPEIKQLQARIRRGADQDLMELFGETRDSNDLVAVAEIDSGRSEILGQGIFLASDLPHIDPATPEIIAILDHEEILYPGFQFNGVLLHPVVAEVNRIIKSTGEMLPWEHAFWWISNTNLLGGKTPLSILRAGEFDSLIEAARQEMSS